MLINFDTPILQIDGSPTYEGQGQDRTVLTMGVLCLNVLMNPIVDAQGRLENLPGTTKVKYSVLAHRIYAGGEIEISVDEASDLKKRIDRGCAYPLIVAQAWALLDPKG